MHAEAAFHNGKEAEARSSLNLVRKRVNLDAITRSGQPLLESIYHERRVELGLEGHRYFDLIRTGRAPAVLGPLGFKEGVNEVLPIPESQILATNGAITQNPGY